ncbi:hypothetical protein OSTOST_19510, partial [Ostertagia ostertagi]
GPRKAREAQKHFGLAPGVPHSHTKPYVRSKGRKFEPRQLTKEPLLVWLDFAAINRVSVNVWIWESDVRTCRIKAVVANLSTGVFTLVKGGTIKCQRMGISRYVSRRYVTLLKYVFFAGFVYVLYGAFFAVTAPRIRENALIDHEGSEFCGAMW